jgi:hypothetical protein
LEQHTNNKMHKAASESSPGYQQQQEVHHDDAILEDGDATEEEMDTDLENQSNEQPRSAVDTPSAVHAASVMMPLCPGMEQNKLASVWPSLVVAVLRFVFSSL